MAIVRAVKSGNWSDTTVWNTGALPTSADDVYSNTFTVTIDISPTVLSSSNATTTGVTAGGSFVPNNGITLTCTGAGITSGGNLNSSCFISNLGSGQSCNIVANCTGSSGGNSHAVLNNNIGTINITGNCQGGSTTSGSSHGVNNNGGGIINITGNCTGSGMGNGHGAINTNGNMSITGICTGGASATASNGAINSNTGTLVHVGPVQASTLSPGIGAGTSTLQVTVLTGPLISSDGSGGTASASGVNPCIALRWFPADTALSTFEYRMRGATVSGSPSVRPARQLFLTDAYAAGYPSAANVRSATTYGPGSIYTGTCAVPPAASVVVGVPVDNTTGTAAITAATIRSAVGLASANLDAQLDALPTAAEAASAVRTELTTELGRIDTSISSRLAPGGTLARVTLADTVTTLTNAPDVPTESEIADAVRTELTTELSRLSNAATVQNVADIVEGAFSLPET